MLLEQTKYWLSLTQEEITMSQKYEKPLIISLNADRDATGLGLCSNGSSNPGGRCQSGAQASAGDCKVGGSAGSKCQAGTLASGRCKAGGNL